MNLENIGKDCPCYEVDCSDIMFDIGEFCGLPPNNGKLTIQVNGSTVGDFTANQQEDETINITTPTSQDIADAVDGEARLRAQADNILQSNIDAIASKSDVVDVVGTYAELQAYDTSKLNDNDVVKVLDDSTHNDTMTYYRWNKTTQTWSYIGQESPYYSKSQTDTLLAQKQDNLAAGTGITLNGSTISADTTVLAEKSELDNYAEKANTYTKTEVDNLVEPKLSVEVVEQLPVQGEENKLYLTPKAHTTQTATGNPITATVTDGAGQIEDFQLDGDTYQQSYSGKNLFEYIPAESVAQGLISTIDSSGVVTVTGTGTARWSDISTFANNTSPSGTYTITVSTTGTGTLPRNISLRLADGGNNNVQTVTLGMNESVTETLVEHTKWRVFLATDTDVVYNCKIKIQVEAGSTASDFQPFVGGIASPNPEYPQPIQVVTGEQTVSKVGKNLFDKNNTNIYHYNPVTQGQALQPLAAANTVFVKIQPNTNITVSSTDRSKLDTYASVVFISGEPETATTWITRTEFGNNDSVSITSPANATYIGVYAIYSTNQATIDASLATIQIEYGSSATTYATYSKTDYPISLGSIELCKLGTYQDYIYKDGDTWKVHKATFKHQFDGIGDNWNYASSTHALQDQNYSVVQTGAVKFDVPGVALSREFTYFPNPGGITTMLPDGCFGFQTTGQYYATFKNDAAFTTKEAAIAWIRANKPTAYWALATPTDTEITDTTLISQLNTIASASLENGSNTITNTATGSNLAGDMEVDYFGYDPTNRYDKWLWLDINNAYEKLGS